MPSYQPDKSFSQDPLVSDMKNGSAMSNATSSKKTFVLCFDGTGNKLTATGDDSNILKIYRMLDREDNNQFHYYQPGIGTYVTSPGLSDDSILSKVKSYFIEAKDSAIGTSFDQHVMAGYRFLMRFYCTGDDIYFFGFSRGAYIARFLAEMLDYIGLLSAGNEELCQFAWRTFAQWQQRLGGTKEEKKEKKRLFRYMTAFRETFSRPIEPIKFLGLFDTVNSVPRFESAWMERSKFPYTAKSSAEVIRHAVSIDERRAKFRQDLISENKTKKKGHHAKGHGHHNQDHTTEANDNGVNGTGANGNGTSSGAEPHRSVLEREATSTTLEDDNDAEQEQSLKYGRFRRRYPIKHNLIPSLRSDDDRSRLLKPSPKDLSGDDASSIHPKEESELTQDIQEVWFSGCHGDIGGGWHLSPGEKYALCHIPLVWMVTEAEKAGLRFDKAKIEAMGCLIDDSLSTMTTTDTQNPHPYLHPPPPDPSSPPSSCPLAIATTTSNMHDSLAFGCSLSPLSVMAWNLMEYLPFRRMDLQPNGSWKPIRWPLPKGEVRDIPDSAWIHNSAIRRMLAQEQYRPGNLILGGGGRGVKTAPKEAGIGEWVPVEGTKGVIGGCVKRVIK
ncbi:MAG: hypothetical protein M1834_005598 [Cirrosporium novae-zelandiae]|nr:MAG: hypothetical protein M1834_005598 [Cirrosporium novae-zelandiae]